MLNHWLKSTTALVAVGAAAGVTMPATAQQAQDTEVDDVALEEIVVQARRRAERMQDIPISMTAVNRLDIDRGGFQELGELTQSVPNFSFQNRGSILGSFGMRGIARAAGNIGTEPGVAVYVDGVPVGRPAAFDAALESGVEQVEVLRGPQGTLFGKNTLSGAVNILTKRPTDTLEGRVKLEVGKYERALASGSLNVPLADDRLMARASIAVEREDGWIQNLFDDREFNGEDNWNGRLQVLARPNEKLSLYWTIDRFYDDRTFITQVNDDPQDFTRNPNVDIDAGLVDVDQPNDSVRDLWGTSFEINYLSDSGYNFTSITGFRNTSLFSLFDGDTTRFKLSDTFEDSSTDQFTQEARVASPDGKRWDFVAGVFYSHQKANAERGTRFFPEDILSGCTVPVSPNMFRGFQAAGPPRATVREAGFDENFAPLWDYDLNTNGIPNEPLASDGVPPGEIVGISPFEVVPEGGIGCHFPGLIAFGRHLPGGEAEDFALPFIDGPVTADQLPDVSTVNQIGSVETDSYAVFLHTNFDITPALTLTGGIRHTWEDKTLEMEQDGAINIKRASFPRFTEKRSDREWSGTASLTYKFSEQFTTFVKFSRGFKSGGFQFDITQGQPVTDFSGFVVSADGQALIKSGLKAGKSRDEIVQDLIDASADPNLPPSELAFDPETIDVIEGGIKTTLFQNRLRFNATGFFSEINGLQAEVLNVNTGIIILNLPESEVYGLEADLTAQPFDGLRVSGGIGIAESEITQVPENPVIDTGNLLGARLGNAPEFTANASATYTFPVSNNGNVVLHAAWSHTGSIFHELEPELGDREKTFEPSYNIVDARIGYVSERNGWEIFFWGKNIFDERYKAFRRSNPIIRNFGIPAGQAFATAAPVPPNRFPGTPTAQSIAGEPATWGVTLQKFF